jgi:hypothetical protein
LPLITDDRYPGLRSAVTCHVQAVLFGGISRQTNLKFTPNEGHVEYVGHNKAHRLWREALLILVNLADQAIVMSEDALQNY